MRFVFRPFLRFYNWWFARFKEASPFGQVLFMFGWVTVASAGYLAIILLFPSGLLSLIAQSLWALLAMTIASAWVNAGKERERDENIEGLRRQRRRELVQRTRKLLKKGRMR